jgi:hypothetical protein
LTKEREKHKGIEREGEEVGTDGWQTEGREKERKERRSC